MKTHKLQILFLGILLTLGLSAPATAQLQGYQIRVDRPDSGKIVGVGDSIVVRVVSIGGTVPSSVSVRIVPVASDKDTIVTKSAIDSGGVVTGSGFTTKFSKAATQVAGGAPPTFRAAFPIGQGDPQFLLGASGRLAVIAAVTEGSTTTRFHSLNKAAAIFIDPGKGPIGDGKIFGIDGVAPTLSATSLSFDSTPMGASSQKTFTVTNTGTAALSVGTITSSNSAFSVSPASLSLAASAVGTFTVTFAPAAAGSQTGAITLPFSKGSAYTTGNLNVTLSGVGVAAQPQISLSATSLAFDSTTVGATSQRTLTIRNTGNASLSVTGIRATGADSSQFTVSPATATVAAGDSARVTVTFAPTSAGAKAASLSIAHNAGGSPASVSLSGVGTAASQPPPSTANVWTKSPIPPEVVIVNALATSGQRVYAVGLGGVYKSTNGGTSWTQVNSGLTNGEVVRAIAIHPTGPDTVYVGIYPGVFKTTNGGTSWTAVNIVLPANTSVNALAIDPKTPQTVYAGTDAGVYKTTNGGASWTAINAGLPKDIAQGIVDALAIDPSSPQTVYAGTFGGGVFKSADGGTAWTAINTGLANTSVVSLAIAPSSPQTVYAGTYEGGMFKTTTGGTSWTAINAGLPADDPGISALAIGPQTIYAGRGANVYTSPLSGSAPQQAPAISLSATSLAFDSTAVGATSQKTLTIKNTGSASLSVTGITITGADSSHFKASPATATLAAGDSVKVTVTFAPTSAGAKAASLSIAHNAAGSPSTVALTGVGKQASTQPPTSVPDPAKQDSTKLGVWLDLNTASGNQYVASASTGPGVEITVQVFGRNLTSSTSFGVTLGFDPAVLTFVSGKFQIGDYLGSSAISLAPQVSTSGGVTAVTFGAALLGGTPRSGNGFLGTAVFKVSDKFTDGYTEIKVNRLSLGTATAAIQTSNAILKALKNAPPVAKFTIKPDAIKAGDTKSLVTLDASGSSDPDGDEITYKWTASAGITFKKSTSDTSTVAQVQVAAETTTDVTFTLTVTDKNGAKATATQTLKVIAPPSATAAVAVDLDPATDNQDVGLLYGAKVGDTFTLQVFVRDVTGVTGYTVKIKYDTNKVESPTYANGPLIAGAIALPAKVGGGVIEGGASILGGSPVSGSGLLATFTFKAKSNFEGGTTLSVTSISLRMGATSKELVTGSIDAQVTADVPIKAGSPAKFSDDDEPVGFNDFFLFAVQFGAKVGDANWDARFDLDGDGEIGFGDFFAFALMFGLTE